MTLRPVHFAALSLLALAACARAPQQVDPATTALIGAPAGAVVASVNGETVTEPLLTVFARGRGLDPADPEQRQRALDALIENLLLAQVALASELAARSDVQAEVALVRVQQLSGRALSHYRENLQIDDDKVRAYYQAEVDRAGDTEWKLQHILFGEEAQAQRVLEAATADGADFEALMREYAGSARQARELDWSNATQLPEELAEAARQLADGEVAPVPIQTRFGWHVLKRAESRRFAPPPLEQVREGARKQLIDQALQEYVAALRGKATIATGATAPAGG